MTNRHGDPASYVRSRQMLIDEIRRRSVATATEGLVREFHNLKPRGYNPNDYNLTELNAAEAVDKGFFSHSDWVAHVARYAPYDEAADQLASASVDPFRLRLREAAAAVLLVPQSRSCHQGVLGNGPAGAAGMAR